MRQAMRLQLAVEDAKAGTEGLESAGTCDRILRRSTTGERLRLVTQARRDIENALQGVKALQIELKAEYETPEHLAKKEAKPSAAGLHVADTGKIKPLTTGVRVSPGAISETAIENAGPDSKQERPEQ